MPVPSPRTPILPARGDKADLTANIASIQEGEICYAFDENAFYVKEGGVLVLAPGHATTTVPGTVRWADATHIAAGTPGHAVDAFYLKQYMNPDGVQLLDMLQWNGTSWVADRRLDGGNF